MAGSGRREERELQDLPDLLTPSEVAQLFRVDPKTVTRWAMAGRITFIHTLGGHRRYRRDEVLKLLAPTKEDTIP